MGNANCYASETYHKLSTEKLKSLGWMANVGLDEMVDRTIKYFKE
jgi:nucleoside-diphosphate-sugar epimerase